MAAAGLNGLGRRCVAVISRHGSYRCPAGDVDVAVCGREARPCGCKLCRGELVAIDPGPGQVETALVVGVGEVRDAVVAHAMGEGEQVPDLSRLAAVFEPGPPICARAARQAAVAWLTTELG